MESLLSGKNPFAGFTERFKVREGKEPNPVHEIVNTYYEFRGLQNKPKEFYKGQFSYSRLATQAKRLLENCGGNLDDALWALDRMDRLASKGNFEWSISTCLKHKLR